MPFNITTFKKTLKSAFSKLEKTQSEALAVEISANFTAGQTAAQEHKSILHGETMEDARLNHGTYFNSADQDADTMEEDDSPLTDKEKAEIATLTALYLGYISEFNSRAQAQILAKVQELSEAGSSQDVIKQYVDSVLDGNENIIIDNVGKTRKEIYVDKELKLSEVKKTITKVYSSNVNNYAQLIGENAAHSGYEGGKKTYNIKQGRNQWVFSGPADERARPWHVALLGEVYTYGDSQSSYAEHCLNEPKCRHRKEPYYGDERDVPKEEWQKLKDDVGLYWDDDEQRWFMRNYKNKPKTPNTTVERDNTKAPKNTIKKDKKVVKEVPKKEVQPKDTPTKTPQNKPVKEKEAPKKEVKLKPRQKKTEVQPKKETKVKEIQKKEQPKNDVENIIKDHEKTIKDRKTEKIFIFDKKGNILLEKEGTKNAVNFEADEIKLFKSAISTHNHPNGSSFSSADIRLACRTNSNEIRATGKNGTYIFKTADGSDLNSQMWDKKISKIYKTHFNDIKQECLTKVRNKEITVDDAVTISTHETWVRVAKELPEFKYTHLKEVE